MTGRLLKLSIYSLVLLLSLKTWALDIDEKLTFRILQTSDTKKTILMNRGLEDGLVVGDHAKFFITTGVFARAVVIRVTPSRSVWSIYRIVKPGQIQRDKVANLKISSPVKVTNDRSKSLAPTYPQGGSRQMGEPVDISRSRPARTSNVMASSSMDEQSELDSIKSTSFSSNHEAEHPATPSKILAKNMAFNISGGYNMVSGTYDNDGASSDADLSAIALAGEYEFLFPKSSEFIQKFSVKAVLGRVSGSTGIADSTYSSIDIGGAVNFHIRNPLATNRFIPYLEIGGGLSFTSLSDIPQSVGSSSTDNLSGSGTYFNFGGGVKYTMDSGFGFFGKADYLVNSSTYTIETTTETIENTFDISGFRVVGGAYYRF